MKKTTRYEQAIEKHKAKIAYLEQRPQQIKDTFDNLRANLKESFKEQFSEEVSKDLVNTLEKFIDFKLEVLKEQYNKEVDDVIRIVPSGGSLVKQ